MEAPPTVDPAAVPPLEREATPPSAWRTSIYVWAIAWCIGVLALGTCGVRVLVLAIGADAY